MTDESHWLELQQTDVWTFGRTETEALDSVHGYERTDKQMDLFFGRESGRIFFERASGRVFFW